MLLTFQKLVYFKSSLWVPEHVSRTKGCEVQERKKNSAFGLTGYWFWHCELHQCSSEFIVIITIDCCYSINIFNSLVFTRQMCCDVAISSSLWLRQSDCKCRVARLYAVALLGLDFDVVSPPNAIVKIYAKFLSYQFIPSARYSNSTHTYITLHFTFYNNLTWV